MIIVFGLALTTVFLAYNPLDKSVKSYLVADGLQDFEFNSNSSYQSKDGELMFAGIRGLNHFYPKDIIPKSNPPQVSNSKCGCWR